MNLAIKGIPTSSGVFIFSCLNFKSNMYLKVLPALIFSLMFLALTDSTSIEEIEKAFDSKICIEGSLSTITSQSTDTILLKESNSDYINFGNVSLVENKKSEKSAVSELNELASYNGIQYYFKLEKEEGPAHNKIFTVSLTLGDEAFVTEQAASLKKAKENLASMALENTEYDKPPIKEKEKNEEALTSTVLLNNLSAKLGIGVTYSVVSKEKEGNYIIDEQSRKTYLQKLNESLYSENDLHIRKEEPALKGPFKVKVQVGDQFYYGISSTIQSARHDAASKALDHLLKHIQEGNTACLEEGSEEQCQQAKAKLKSPISLVYEAAQLRNLEVTFEIISESGPSHKKVFVSQCRLGHLSTQGEGSSKKESKKAAAINMLDRISELPEVSREKLVKNVLKDNKNKNKKKKKILKTNFDVVNMHLNNLVGSVLDFGLPFTKGDNDNPTDNPKTAKKTDKQKVSRKSYQDEILELSNLLNFEIQFMDIDGENRFYTLMSLHINPQHICLGQGLSKDISRDKAARGGLKLLENIDLETHFKNKKYLLVEREVKEKIRSILYREVYEEETQL